MQHLELKRHDDDEQHQQQNHQIGRHGGFRALRWEHQRKFTTKQEDGDIPTQQWSVSQNTWTREFQDHQDDRQRRKCATKEQDQTHEGVVQGQQRTSQDED